MWRPLAWIGAAAATMAVIMAVLSSLDPTLKDGFYAPTEALCRTGPTAIDSSLSRPWVGHAVNVQKVAYSWKYPDRLIVDNLEICVLVRRHKQADYLRCSHGGNADQERRYTYFDRNGAIYLDGREFRYCGPVTPPQ